MGTRLIRFGAILAATSALGACADFQRATASFGPAPVNVESPVAGAVVAAQDAPMRFPSFRDVPAKIELKQQRTGFEWSRNVNSLNRDGGEIDLWAGQNPVIAPTTTAAYEANALKALRYDERDLPPADQAARTESFASSLRSTSEPPPLPK